MKHQTDEKLIDKDGQAIWSMVFHKHPSSRLQAAREDYSDGCMKYNTEMKMIIKSDDSPLQIPVMQSSPQRAMPIFGRCLRGQAHIFLQDQVHLCTG